jgi:hypothetical protein
MRRVWLLLPLLLLAGWCVLPRAHGTTALHPVDWTRDPVQTPTDQPAFTIATRKGPVTLRPRYRFEISAVVAGAERYRMDDGAFLSPLDLALVWGELPGEPYWNQVHYTQTGRYYLWGTSSPELDLAYIPAHSSNMHMIPADANVRRALLAAGTGDWVRLRGSLVDVAGPGGFTWTSSTSRVDTGPGACEVVWVEEAQVGDWIYR